MTSSGFFYSSFYLWKAFGLLEDTAFYGNMSLNSFIKSCFKSIKLNIIVFRSHLNNTIFNVKHKRFNRKVFIIPNVTIFEFCFVKIAFVTDNIILWKSDKPVSTATEFWKFFNLSLIIRSMQEGFNGFLKQVLSLIRFLQL